MTTLGDIIKEYRTSEDRNISIRTFASMSGLSPSYIFMLERGYDQRGNEISPSISTISVVASAMNKSFEDVFNKLDCNVIVNESIQNTSKVVKSPDLEDVQMLIDNAPEDFKPILYLAAFGGLRRGEICALKQEDISRDMCTVFVHADFVLDEYNVWHYKPMPKTVKSVRTVKLPSRVIELLGTGSPDAYVVGVMPDKITKGFYRLKKNHKIDIRFHDLRHYYASIGSILGIPDFVMADFGGWEHDSKSLKQSYQGNIKSITDGYSKKLNDHFDTLIENV